MAAATVSPRVVVADDSALMRQILESILRRGGIEVVGSARDGDEALSMCASHEPDALALDMTMPGLGGLDVLRALREPGRRPIPVVVVSAFSPAHGARAIDALAEGAFDLVTKPNGSDGEVDAFAVSLLAKIRLAAQARRLPPPLATVAALPAPSPPQLRPPSPPAIRVSRATRTNVARMVLIATSTGGPRALAQLLPELPAPLGLGTLIVQHMPAGFTASLAARLDRASELTVREAVHGESPDPSVALIAPGGRHLHLDPSGDTVLSDEAPLGGLRPRADLLIADAARRYGDRLVLVVLTGMGSDGLRGAEEVRRQGGRILAEAEETCTVYGMPRAVIDAKLADVVAPLDELPAAIAAEARG